MPVIPDMKCIRSSLGMWKSISIKYNVSVQGKRQHGQMSL